MGRIKKIFFIFLIFAGLIGLLFFSESDTTRLVRAYRYNNPLLCNLVLDGNMRIRCTAVIEKDFGQCDKIDKRDLQSFSCYFGVALNKGDLAAGDEFSDLMAKEYNTSYEPIKELFMYHLAFKLGNSSLCSKANSDRRDYCFQAIDNNVSYLCSLQFPDICNAAYAVRNDDLGFCRDRGDLCYANTAFLLGDRKICDRIASTEIMNDCYLELTDYPYEIRTMGASSRVL